jgi:hypothetical protein
MKVHVEDELPSVSVTVDHQPIAAFGVTALAGYFRCCDKKMSHAFRVGGSDLIDGVDVLEGNEQQVGRSVWMDVLECEAVFIPIDHLSWDLSVADFAKQAIEHSKLRLERLPNRPSPRSWLSQGKRHE